MIKEAHTFIGSQHILEDIMYGEIITGLYHNIFCTDVGDDNSYALINLFIARIMAIHI